VILRLLFAALLLAPLAAQADGQGIALSDDARLHFFFESELRYDSLAGQGGIGASNGSGPTAVDPADFILHIRPGAKVIEQGTELQLTGLANIDYVDYTGWLAPTHQLSYLGAAVQAALAVGGQGPVGFNVSEAFNRSDQTTNPSLGIGSITDSNNLGARVAFRPGGGAIEAGLGYTFGIESYELHSAGDLGSSCTDSSCNGALYGDFDSQTHRFALDARWKFFPKTAIVFDSSFELREYSTTVDSMGNVINRPSDPFLVEAGLAGLITEKVRLVLKGGYSNTLSQSGDTFSGPVAQLEAGWDPSETASITAGALRTVQPVSGTYGWYDDWRGYLSARVALGGRFALSGSANLDILFFANSDRQDTQAMAQAALDVELFRMLHASIGAILTSRDSSLGGVFTYQRTEAFIRLNFTY